MIRIGLLGCGNIGHIIARHAEEFTIPAVYDTIPERAGKSPVYAREKHSGISERSLMLTPTLLLKQHL